MPWGRSASARGTATRPSPSRRPTVERPAPRAGRAPVAPKATAPLEQRVAAPVGESGELKQRG